MTALVISRYETAFARTTGETRS